MEFNKLVAFMLVEYRKGFLLKHPTSVMSNVFIEHLLDFLNQETHELQRQNRIAIDALRKVGREEGTFNADVLEQTRSIAFSMRDIAKIALTELEISPDLPPAIKKTLVRTTFLKTPAEPKPNNNENTNTQDS